MPLASPPSSAVLDLPIADTLQWLAKPSTQLQHQHMVFTRRFAQMSRHQDWRPSTLLKAPIEAWTIGAHGSITVQPAIETRGTLTSIAYRGTRYHASIRSRRFYPSTCRGVTSEKACTSDRKRLPDAAIGRRSSSAASFGPFTVPLPNLRRKLAEMQYL